MYYVLSSPNKVIPCYKHHIPKIEKIKLGLLTKCKVIFVVLSQTSTTTTLPQLNYVFRNSILST